MKFLTLFKIILISNVCVLYCNANLIGESPSDRYEQVMDKSIRYIKYCFHILNKLENIRKTTNELICGMNIRARKINLSHDGNTNQNREIKEIIKELEKLLNDINTQIDEWDSNNWNSKTKDNATIGKLIELYGDMIRLITKFNSLRDQTEMHIENVSHDISNFDTLMESKEKITDEIEKVIAKLSKEFKTLYKNTVQEINNCNKQIENMEKKSKPKENNTKEKETKEKDNTTKKKKDKSDNADNKKENNSDNLDEDIETILDNIPLEKIKNYINKKTNAKKENKKNIDANGKSITEKQEAESNNDKKEDHKKENKE